MNPGDLIPTKLIALAVALKGTTMGGVALLVIPMATLTNFEKGLIIAAVSASVTGVFTVLAAVVAIRMTVHMHQSIEELRTKAKGKEDCP